MGLNFGTLVNAALGGSAAYMGGKREARVRAEKAAQEQELKLSMMTENAAQAASARAAAELSRAKTEHPENFRNAPAARAVPEYEAFKTYIEEKVAGGMKPEDARRSANLYFGKTDPQEHGPVRGSKEYYQMIDKEEGIRDRHQKSGTGGRDTGEAGSAKAATDRREFMQNRITHYTDAGYTGAEAQTAAEREYLGANYSANKTASVLARSIPKGSSSSNAGTRGVKPTETSSTQKHDPTNANSPKMGTMRQATDADIDRAIAAVGEDEAKIEKWLHDRRLEP